MSQENCPICNKSEYMDSVKSNNWLIDDVCGLCEDEVIITMAKSEGLNTRDTRNIECYRRFRGDIELFRLGVLDLICTNLRKR